MAGLPAPVRNTAVALVLFGTLLLALAGDPVRLSAQEAPKKSREGDSYPWRTGSVSGRVVDVVGGAGVGEVRLELCRYSSSTSRPIATTLTLLDGKYRFDRVPPGAYLIRVRHAQPGRASDAVAARVLLEPVNAGDLVIRKGQAVTGVVREYDSGLPAAGVTIQSRIPGGGWDEIVTDAEGKFRIDAQPQRVLVFCLGKTSELSACDPTGEVSEGSSRRTVQLAADNDQQIEFHVRAAPIFRGRVLLPDGQPAVGADVQGEASLLTVNLPQRAAMRFRHSGNVDFLWHDDVPAAVLEPGLALFPAIRQFKAKTDENGWYSVYMDFESGESPHNPRRALSLRSITAQLNTESLAGVSRNDELAVKLAPTGSLSFLIVDEHGRPLTDFELLYRSQGGQTHSFAESFIERKDSGVVTISGVIPDLSYQISLRAPLTAVVGITPPVRPNLQRKFGTKTVKLSAGEARAVEEWRPRPVRGRESVLAGLTGSDAAELTSALAEFEFLASDGAYAVEALVKLLKSGRDAGIRKKAAVALGQIGPPARQAVPNLLELCRVPEQQLPLESLFGSLGKIQDPRALDALEEFARSDKLAIAEGAVEGLFQFPAQESVPRLANLLERGTLAQARVCERLEQLGPAAAAAVPQLVRLLGERPPIAARAAAALGATGDISAIAPLLDFASSAGDDVNRFSFAAFAIDQIYAAKYERR